MHPHDAHHAYLIWTTIAGILTGGTFQRFMVYVSHSLPPLPANAGWWQTFAYNLVKGISGLDPSAKVIPPPKP